MATGRLRRQREAGGEPEAPVIAGGGRERCVGGGDQVLRRSEGGAHANIVTAAGKMNVSRLGPRHINLM